MSKSKMIQNLETCLQSIKEFHSLSNPKKIIEYAKKELQLVHLFTIAPQFINDYLYRVRTQESMKCDDELLRISSFSYVPKEQNKKGFPSIGRFNKDGESVFYASLYGTTNLKEMKDNIKEGDIVYLSKWKIKDNTPIRLYYIYPPDTTQDNPFLNLDLHPLLLENLKEIGGILLDNEEEKNKYLKSSLIGNQIFNFKEKGVSFDAILYPSVLGDKYEYNLAIKPEFVDANIELQCVYEAVVKDNTYSINCSRIGINENGKVKWYDFFCSYTDIVVDSFSFLNSDKVPYTDYISIVNCGNKEYEISELAQFLANSTLSSINGLQEEGFFRDEFTMEDELTDICRKRSKYYDIKVDNVYYYCNNVRFDVSYIRVWINYSNSLNPIEMKSLSGPVTY